MDKQTQIKTSGGMIRGRQEGDTFAFLGIPYAEAERFRAPQPARWEGVKDCLDYAPVTPQANYRGQKQPGFVYAMRGAEEGSLALNIWTKHPQAGAKLPVAVMVHGGAFQVGTSQMEPEVRAGIAPGKDIVLVSVTYRVGVLGFLELGDLYGGAYRGSGNNGSLDLLLALEWIYDNIEAFGGDRDNLTVLAISAGAKNMGSLLTLPRTQRIVHKLVLESGAMQSFRTVETALRVQDAYMARLPEGTDLLTAPAEKLVEVQAEFCATPGSTCFFGPVLEAPFDPDWMEKWDQGQRFQGSAVVGGSLHEMCLTTRRPDFLEKAETIARDMFGDQADIAIAKVEALAKRTGDPRAAWTDVLSDFMYRFYTTRLARKLESDGNRVWAYSMDMAPGAHGQGFGFLNGQVEPPGEKLPEETLQKALALSRFVQARIGEYIVNGEPDPALWQEYRGGHKMIYSEDPHMEYRPDDTLSGFPPRVLEYKN